MKLPIFFITGLLIAAPLQYCIAADKAATVGASQTVSSTNQLTKFLIKHHYTYLPIINKNGLLYVKGKVKNNPVYVLLDTGSSSASILADSIKQLKLKPVQTKEKVTNMTGSVTHVKKVTLPDLTIGPFQIISISESIMQQPFKNNLPTIVVGNHFFEKYNAIFDIKNQLLFLSKDKMSRKSQYKLKQLLQSDGFQKQPLDQLGTNGPYILPV